MKMEMVIGMSMERGTRQICIYSSLSPYPIKKMGIIYIHISTNQCENFSLKQGQVQRISIEIDLIVISEVKVHIHVLVPIPSLFYYLHDIIK